MSYLRGVKYMRCETVCSCSRDGGSTPSHASLNRPPATVPNVAAQCNNMCHFVAACCDVLQCVAVCCSVVQCGVVCCSVLQRVAVCFT